MRVARASPSVSHLLFADDSLFFVKAESRECMEIKRILGKYERASGQCVNFDKSSLMFGKSVPESVKAELKGVLGINTEGGLGNYLGIPEDISGSRCKVFAFITERLQEKVNLWSAKWLSKGGKEVLIKSVALSLPTYVMSSFLLPLDTCDKITSAIARYWWSSNPPRRGVHWATWDKLCASKDEGGLGFRTIHEFNLALLAKQLWRLLRFPNSLLARVLRGRYYRLSSPLQVDLSDRPSYGWRSIMAARPLLLRGLRKKIHSGLNTKVWMDPWIPSFPARSATASVPVVHPQMVVSDFIDRDTKEWNVEMLRQFIAPGDIPLIRSLPIARQFKLDSFTWQYTKSGMYSVRSGYRLARQMGIMPEEVVEGPTVQALQKLAWTVDAPSKICHLMWQILSGYISLTHNLNHHGLMCPDLCPTCGSPEETAHHTFFQCPLAVQTWSHLPEVTAGVSFPFSSAYTGMAHLFSLSNLEEHTHAKAYPWLLWNRWTARNDKLFRGLARDPFDLFSSAVAECQDWCVARAQREVPQVDTRYVDTVESLRNICLIDGSWKESDIHSGLGWNVIGDNQDSIIMGAKNKIRRVSPLHSEVEALIFALTKMLEFSLLPTFGTDSQDLITMIGSPDDWPDFETELMELKRLQDSFPSFSIRFVPRTFNLFADKLARLARRQVSLFSFSGCSIPGWLAAPTQA